MQSKTYNSYKITHKNGNVEVINAENLVKALENMEISEEYSPVLQTYMQDENIRTLVSDLPEEVPFTCVVAEGSGGSIATPLSGTVHAGDKLSFRAIPDTGYEFVNWKMNDKVVSEEASFVYTFPTLGGEASAVFKATFRLAPVSWESEVLPVEATTAGCIAFPLSGTAEVGSTLSLIAVEVNGLTFDHWEKNGESIGTNKILTTEVTALTENETSCKYTAVFTAQ